MHIHGEDYYRVRFQLVISWSSCPLFTGRELRGYHVFIPDKQTTIVGLQELDWADISNIFNVRFTLTRRGRKGQWEAMHVPAMANDNRIGVRIEIKNTDPIQYEVQRRGSIESLSPQVSEDLIQIMAEMSEQMQELVKNYNERLSELMDNNEMEESEEVARVTNVGGPSSSMSKENAMQVAPIISYMFRRGNCLI